MFGRKHTNGGSAIEPVALHVPPAIAQQRVTCGGEAGEVRHLAPSRERKRGVAWQVEPVLNPCSRDLFHDARGRSASVERGVVVPGGGEPVSGERGRQRTANYPREEPPADRAQMPAFRCSHQLVDHAFSGNATLDQFYAEPLPQRRGIDVRGDRPVGQPVEKVGGMSLGAFEQRAGSRGVLFGWRDFFKHARVSVCTPHLAVEPARSRGNIRDDTRGCRRPFEHVTGHLASEPPPFGD